jgi:hypothetical protein
VKIDLISGGFMYYDNGLNNLILKLDKLASESDFVEFSRKYLYDGFSKIFDFELKELKDIGDFRLKFLYHIDENDLPRTIYANIRNQLENDFGSDVAISDFSAMKIFYFRLFFLNGLISLGTINKTDTAGLLIFKDIFNLFVDIKMNSVHPVKYKTLLLDPKYLLIIRHRYSRRFFDVMKGVYLNYLWEKELLPKYDLIMKALING